jgi:hypothetical protein
MALCPDEESRVSASTLSSSRISPIITPNGEIQFPRVPVFVRRDLFTAFWRLNLEHVVGAPQTSAGITFHYTNLRPRTGSPEHAGVTQGRVTLDSCFLTYSRISRLPAG